MNARIGGIDSTLVGPSRTRARRPRAPEAVEVMRRILLLTVPLSAARLLVGAASDAWPSAVYYALARRELDARERRRTAPGTPEGRVSRAGGAARALSRLRAALGRSSLEEVVPALLELLDASRLDDPVVLRRVLGELDVWAFSLVRQPGESKVLERCELRLGGPGDVR